MKRGPRIIALGAVIIAVAVATRGGVSFGFGKSLAPFAFHCALLYLIIGVADIGIGGNVSGRMAFFVALVSIPILFVLSSGILYLDLIVVTPRPYSKPQLSSILIDRLTFSLVVGAAGLGYPVATDHGKIGRGTTLKATIVGVVLWTSSLVLSRTVYGTAPGFTEVFYVLLGIATIAGAIALYLTARFDISANFLSPRINT